MNEQNIQNIIAYFTQNPSQKTEDLIQSLLSSGYPRIDIDEALARMGMTRAKKELPVKQLTMIAIVLVLAGGVILGARAALSLYLSRQPAQPASNSAQPIPTVSNQISDPIQPTHDILSRGSYKISIEQTITDPDPSNNEQSTLTYFTENGVIVRFEHSAGTILLIQNENIYLLDSNKKTYTAYTASAAQKDTLFDTVSKTDVIRNFIDNTEKGVYTWQKVNEKQWNGRNTQTGHTFNVYINPKTGLLERVEEFDEKSITISESTLQIEPVEIQNEILAIPPDYTGVKYEIQ